MRRVAKALSASVAAASVAISISVTAPKRDDAEKTAPGARPSHHLNDSRSLFENPWPSFRPIPAGQLPSTLFKFITSSLSDPFKDASSIPVKAPDWGAAADPSNTHLKATWVGHAGFLVELPAPATPDFPSRGVRILFDPVFSHRCSPVSFMGPARFTPSPCPIEEIPDVDLVVISHNHYDHMDTSTLQSLIQRERPPHIFAPLNNDTYFKSIGIKEGHFHCLDWWEATEIKITFAPSSTEQIEGSKTTTTDASIKLTCTPCQHASNRGTFDRNHTLWSSWAVEDTTLPNQEGAKVWFAGDTAYKTIQKGDKIEDCPVCPAFKEIGDKFGGFDLALIPIGAYAPITTFSCVHTDPEGSVNIFQDVKAKRALGMHWGTWRLTLEDILEPPKELAEACKKFGVPDGAFTTCDIGETVLIERK